MRGVAACCVIALCGGCTLLFASNLDDDGAPPEGTTEAGPSSTDASASDVITATVDAPAGDATIAPVDGATRFCATLSPAPKFCDDFDDPNTTIAMRWDRIFVNPTNIGVVETSDVALAGKSMSVRMNGAGDCSYTRVEKELATNGKDLRFSFSMRPTGPWSSDAKSYAMVRFKTGGTIACQFFLQVDGSGGVASGGLTLFQWGSSQTSDVFYSAAWPSTDVWSKIDVTVRANGSVLHTVNGTIADDRAFPTGCTFADSVTIGLGYHCEDESPEIRYENVVVDYP